METGLATRLDKIIHKDDSHALGWCSLGNWSCHSPDCVSVDGWLVTLGRALRFFVPKLSFLERALAVRTRIVRLNQFHSRYPRHEWRDYRERETGLIVRHE